MIRLCVALGLSALLIGGCGTPAPAPAQESPEAEQSTSTETPTSTPIPAAEPTETPEPTATPSPYEAFRVVAGDWTGSWTNTTFGSTGGATIGIALSPDGTASFTLDLDGLVFGLLDPEPEEFGGSYDAAGATFGDANNRLFGNVTITISADGDILFEATGVPAPGIESITAEGTISADAIEMSYTVTFTGGGTAEGVMSLTPA